MSDSLRHQTAIATRWSTITEVAARLVLPLVNMVLARLLTPDAFGVVATITMIVSFAEIFADAGFQKYIIQHNFNTDEELNQSTDVAFWTNLGVSLVTWVVILINADSLAALVGNPGLGEVVVVAALSLPLLAFSSIQMSRFKRDMDFKTLFKTRLVSIGVPIVVTIPLAYITRSYWALIIGTLASNLANAIMLTLRSKWKPRLYYSFSHFKKMFAYSWWILLESISVWVSSYADTFIVSLYLTTYYIGLYKTAMATVSQIVGLIVAATSMPLFVALSRLQNSRNRLITTYNGYMQAIAMFLIPLSVGIWFYRDLVTDILLGSQWTEACNFIGLWGLTSSVALVLGTYANGLYNAVGKTYLSFWVSLLNVVWMIPVVLWACHQGFESLYISKSVLRIVFIFSQLATMVLILKYPIMSLLRKLIAPLLCTAVMSIAILLLQMVSNHIVWQLVSVVLCAAIYFLTAYVWFKKTLFNSFETLGLNPNILFRKWTRR